jgi:hypothetical protein
MARSLQPVSGKCWQSWYYKFSTISHSEKRSLQPYRHLEKSDFFSRGEIVIHNLHTLFAVENFFFAYKSRSQNSRNFDSFTAIGRIYIVNHIQSLATSWSPVQGVLPTVLDLVTEAKQKISWRRPRPELGCRAKRKRKSHSKQHLVIFIWIKDIFNRERNISNANNINY